MRPALDNVHGDVPLRRRWLLGLNGRTAALLWVAVFCSCMLYAYIFWLYPNYWYLGFELKKGSHPALALSLVLIFLSASLLPTKLDRFSDYVSWMLFYSVYVPSLLFVPLQGLLPDGGFEFVIAMAISFSLMQLIARARMRLPEVRVGRRTLIGVLFVIYVGLNLYVLSIFSGNLRIASFAEVYTQRFAASDLIEGSLAGYASGILSGAFNPFMMALGLTQRRRVWLWVGIAGQVFVYATAAMKSVLLSCVFVPVFYYFLIRHPNISAARLGMLIVASCAAPLMLTASVLESQGGESLLWSIVSLILMRTYGMTGALSGVYADFFTSHPYTYFSHVNLISTFVPYPYKESLGEEVGWYMVGSKLDANANFWASDGTAALGHVGIVVMGVVVGLFLMVGNSVVRPEYRRLAFVAFVEFVVAISNTSFFTSLLSGGGGILLLILYLWQSSGRTGPADTSRVA